MKLETAEQPVELGVLVGGDDVVDGVGVDGWRRVRRVWRVGLASIPSIGLLYDSVAKLRIRHTQAAAKRFFKRLLRSHGGDPRKIVTDKLRSYGVAHRELDGDAQP